MSKKEKFVISYFMDLLTETSTNLLIVKEELEKIVESFSIVNETINEIIDSYGTLKEDLVDIMEEDKDSCDCHSHKQPYQHFHGKPHKSVKNKKKEKKDLNLELLIQLLEKSVVNAETGGNE